MLRPILLKVRRELSGQRALDHVAEIIQHHRIQASPGYRAAARAVAGRYAAGGVSAVLTPYPATADSRFWTYPVPREWECTAAECWLTDESDRPIERLCSYDELPLSLIQRSAATLPEGVLAAVAAVDRADDPVSYRRRDLRGKLVLIGGENIMRAAALARQAGAVGILTDRMPYHPPVRPEGDLADARCYTSFWWEGREPDAWGFVLSPRQGARLRRLLAAGRPVRVLARVSARFYDGTIENVEAIVPGQTDEQVLIVSHLCHPKPSANDNATGPAVCIEAARTLTELMRRGELERPRRSIRFLHVPEMTGTFAYCATRGDEVARTAGALNVDMIGQDQAQTGSVLLAEYPPLATPSYAGDLAALVLAEVAREVGPYSGTGDRYALFRHAAVAFNGGSDHYILADPSVGVPCPSIGQWPDRFYHTSADTLDKVSPDMLARVGALVATYAYFLAGAGAGAATWLAGEMAAMFPAQLHAAARQAAERGQAVAEAVAFRTRCKQADLQSLGRLVPDDDAGAASFAAALGQYAAELEQVADRELQRWDVRAAQPATDPAAASEVGQPAGSAPAGSAQTTDWARRAAAIRPRRRWPGPVRWQRWISRLPAADQDAWYAYAGPRGYDYTLEPLLLYWADGRRSLAEICRLVELESGLRDDEFAVRYFDLLSRLELVTLEAAAD